MRWAACHDAALLRAVPSIRRTLDEHGVIADLAGRLLSAAGLADRPREIGRAFPPRVRARELWRVAPDIWIRRRTTPPCWRSATRSAPDSTSSPTARCGARAIPTASPPRWRASTSTIPARRSIASGHPNPVPRVVGRSAAACGGGAGRGVPARQHRPHDQDHRARPVHHGTAGAERFLQDEEELALDYAAAVNAEINDLFAAGADIVQIDEPYMQARPRRRANFGLTAVNRALEGMRGTRPCISALVMPPLSISAPTAIRSCPNSRNCRCRRSQSRRRNRRWIPRCWKAPGKTIILGILDLSDMTVETPETVAARIRRALPHVPAPQSVVAPDCGLKYLPRDVAFGKMRAMVEGAGIVRRELAAI